MVAAQAEADVLVWDGGNNDLPFYDPNVHVVVADPLRAGHETRYHPVEANLRMWVDGPNRRPDEVEPSLRSFVGKMQRRALELQASMRDEVEEELLVPDVRELRERVAA